MAKKKLKPHEIIAAERVVRKYVKQDDTGFRKNVSAAGKKAARAALNRLGRKKLTWDHSINLKMINYKSKVVPRLGS